MSVFDNAWGLLKNQAMTCAECGKPKQKYRESLPATSDECQCNSNPLWNSPGEFD